MSATDDVLDVSILIPFKDKAAMTIACLDSLQRYGGAVKEVLLISNNSSDAELTSVKQAVTAYPNTHVVVYNHPFNYQKINNWAAKKTESKVVMLLNNDVELGEFSKDLLAKMYQKAVQPKVGAVGCVLLYEDNKTIQHAGVYLVPGATANELYRGKPLRKTLQSIVTGGLKYDIRTDMPVGAVTAAAVMIERKKYDGIDGLNEAFVIGGGDVDLCFRLEDAGYKNWLMGFNNGYFIHKESKSRSVLSVPYSDFVESYKSYVKHFDLKTGDRYLDWKDVAHES